jgi:mono/diheme cytochrome c family protein
MKRFLPGLIALTALFCLGSAPVSAQDAAAGGVLFKQKCSACHQVTGLGIKGAFPALAGDPFVVGDDKIVAKTVLLGRGGMPSFMPVLTDQQIADILTYVRSSWGNKGSAVPPADVAEVRAQVPASEQKDKGN